MPVTVLSVMTEAVKPVGISHFYISRKPLNSSCAYGYKIRQSMLLFEPQTP